MKSLNDILQSEGVCLLNRNLIGSEQDLLKEIIKLAFVAGQVDELHRIEKIEGKNNG